MEGGGYIFFFFSPLVVRRLKKLSIYHINLLFVSPVDRGAPPFFFPPCPREQELEVEANLAMEKKSKATPTFLLAFFACLLTVPMVYFVRKGYATHRAAVPASVNRELSSVVESNRSESSAVKTGGYGAA